jgi:enoyl-CoA hydratase
MTYQQLIYEPGPVARVILNRPEYRNALSRVLFEEIDQAFAEAAADSTVKVVVLSGNGPTFCAGIDRGSPPELADRELRPASTDPREQSERGREMWIGRMQRFSAIPKPLIAMVQGYCINAGSMLAQCMDVVFAADDAQFSFTDSQYPLFLDGPGKARLVRDIFFEGRPVTASEALTLGFVSRVYPIADLAAETLAYAERVAAKHPWHLAVLKRSIEQTLTSAGYLSTLEVAHHVLSTTRSVSGPPGIRRRPENADTSTSADARSGS